jgi:hypothetical protein
VFFVQFNQLDRINNYQSGALQANVPKQSLGTREKSGAVKTSVLKQSLGTREIKIIKAEL